MAAPDQRIDQPFTNGALAARQQQVDLDKHLHARRDGRVAVAHGDERRAGRCRQVQHAHQDPRRMGEAQNHGRDHAADERAEHTIEIALARHAKRRLEDHDNGQQHPVAVRRIRQVVGNPQPGGHRHRDAQRKAQHRRPPRQFFQHQPQFVFLACEERRHVRRSSTCDGSTCVSVAACNCAIRRIAPRTVATDSSSAAMASMGTPWWFRCRSSSAASMAAIS